MTRPRCESSQRRTPDDVLAELAATGLLQYAEAKATAAGISVEELIAPQYPQACLATTAVAARARHELWLELRERFRKSYPELGRLFGVDDSTVRYGVRSARQGAVP